MRHISVRGNFVTTVTNLASANYPSSGGDVVRVALVYDKQANAVAPSYGDVYNANNVDTAPFANPNTSNLERFIILAQIERVVCGTNNTLFSFEFEVPCNLEVRFNTGNAGSINDIVTGSVFLMCVDQCSNVINAGSLIQLSRIVFEDS
jgi:hypothetical protein